MRNEGGLLVLGISVVTCGLAAFVADFQAGAAVPCIIAQGVEWHLSPTHVNYANNLNVLLV